MAIDHTLVLSALGVISAANMYLALQGLRTMHAAQDEGNWIRRGQGRRMRNWGGINSVLCITTLILAWFALTESNLYLYLYIYNISVYIIIIHFISLIGLIIYFLRI